MQVAGGGEQLGSIDIAAIKAAIEKAPIEVTSREQAKGIRIPHLYQARSRSGRECESC